ncbi:hypothetical protein CCMA1212_006427 [Trichoderma ghanense]|uniref:Uncharacterized protein n=1 Tax=Trichoderma ghanense TaxID=65468 RepID=A0ABY2GZX5_9HYPO
MKPSPASPADAVSTAHVAISPKHDDEKWLALPREVREDVAVQEPLILPDLKATSFSLLQDIRCNRLVGAESLPYNAAIKAHGGPEAPASRLAFHVGYTTLDGQERRYFHTNKNASPLFRANTFVDILTSGSSDEDIAKTPRRYLHVKAGSLLSDELSEFVGGGYTSELPRP